MTKHFLLLLFSICLSSTIRAQTYNSGGGPIPDNGPAALFPINVTGLPLVPMDSSFGVESVCVNITHNNDYQLTIQLVAPDGSTVDLSMNNGGGGNNYTGTCFTGNATTPITSGSAPFSGNYRAQGILGNINNGQAGNGTWQLKIQDHNFGTSGTLNSWSITFSNTPAYPFVFNSSNLPIVLINTNGQTIVDDPKKIVHMGIIDNGPGIRNYITDPFNSYDGNIAIEIRGSWSQTFPQKQYGFETLDAQNLETDTMVMGMPAQSDWILYAPYNDKTCMRDVLAYDIANKTGHYASRTRFCELMINNDYKGIYVMMEKVKRDSNRVDISKLTPADTSGDAITGGYIFKLDKSTGSGGGGWLSNFNGIPGVPIEFQYEYPSDVDILPQQKTYIQMYVDSFEKALNAPWFANADSGYSKYIDVPSFIDYFILTEVTKNVDSYRNSTFLYKKKITKGGKLFAGPAWDYNIGFWNADYCQGYLFTGWQYQYNNICSSQVDNNVPFWWGKLLQDPVYTEELRCRWQELRLTVLNTDTLFNFIDGIADTLNESKNRHFTEYPILGVQVWANPLPVALDYAGEISNMKNWIQQRLAWLDANIPGVCTLNSLQNITASSQNVFVYPNPFNNRFKIRCNLNTAGPVEILIEDVAGRTVYKTAETGITTGTNEFQVNCNNLPAGIYLLRITTGDVSYNLRIVAK